MRRVPSSIGWCVAERPRVVAIAVGNRSRGDDALGPLLLERIEAHFAQVVTVEDFQLQIEHALVLEEADLVLFIDAAMGLEPEWELTEVHPDAAVSPLTHALSPSAVLEVFARIARRAPPPAFVLALRGSGFELGAPLSDSGRVALEAAWRGMQTLFAAPQVQEWRAAVATRPGLSATALPDAARACQTPLVFQGVCSPGNSMTK
jgi:hydrogenase maturation protease